MYKTRWSPKMAWVRRGKTIRADEIKGRSRFWYQASIIPLCRERFFCFGLSCGYVFVSRRWFRRFLRFDRRCKLGLKIFDEYTGNVCMDMSVMSCNQLNDIACNVIGQGRACGWGAATMHNIGSNSHRRLIDANAVTARGRESAEAWKKPLPYQHPGRDTLGSTRLPLTWWFSSGWFTK